MTAAQPNNLGHLAGTFTDDDAASPAATRGEAEPQPEYVGDMPEDPEQARSYRPGEDQPEDQPGEETR
jgi:hypothetical protein